MHYFFLHTRKGFATVEILIAATIISVTLIALVLATGRAVDLSIESVERVQASFLLEESAESVKLIRDTAWTSISSLTIGTTYYLNFSGATWTLTTTPPATIDGYTRTIVFSNVYRDGSDDIAGAGTLDDGTRLVTSTVSWNSVSGPKTESIQFYVANIFE